ncbi:uncharacterized protein LOC112345799 isoform X2 [Selaginella moellendorffii]|uniref:uncharacterized protein LOC112345799 isoform X2 n=1 Tax=Selaginella moellendorffii TaxID=88036 RepID=UPI000D1C8C7F|nr:uncharacterized protein LOC112345799 isoform X2 [Selaginella moellendorffii]|eukprot:XP_024529020.1 uncharacterized protein LOC112345799 isoform X2 [Selaginella moellendorffii]
MVAALGRSSSRVVDCNTDSSQEFNPPPASPAPKNDHGSRSSLQHHNLFSCFTGRKIKPSSTSGSSWSWPRSPSIMSRLLLSPSMSPDNRMGDQSPARGNHHSHKIRSFTFSAAKARKNRRFDDPEEESSSNRGEPTSPKVTCMGTVKAPKSCKAKTARPPPRCPGSKNLTHHHQQVQDSLLDLSRLSSKSGELRRSKATGLGHDQRPSSHGHTRSSSSLSNRKISSMDCQVPSLQSQQMVPQSTASMPAQFTTASSLQPIDLVKRPSISPAAPLKRPEEVCIWRRRCVPEPLRLDIMGSVAGQLKARSVSCS